MRFRKALLFVVIVISGCTPALRSVVFNNTSKPITVELCSEKYEIPVGAYSEISAILCEQAPNIKIGDITFYYEAKFVNYPIEKKYGSYVEKKIGERVIKYQINESGVVLLVPVNENFPYVQNIEQPNGFPMKPKNS
jgi:hypothetical protein